MLYAAQPFLKSARGDTESSKRQDPGANTDVRLRAFAKTGLAGGCRIQSANLVFQAECCTFWTRGESAGFRAFSEWRVIRSERQTLKPSK